MIFQHIEIILLILELEIFLRDLKGEENNKMTQGRILTLTRGATYNYYLFVKKITRIVFRCNETNLEGEPINFKTMKIKTPLMYTTKSSGKLAILIFNFKKAFSFPILSYMIVITVKSATTDISKTKTSEYWSCFHSTEYLP